MSTHALIAQLVKNPPAMQKTLVRFLGLKDPLEKGKVTHSSILAWRMPWTGLYSPWGCRVGQLHSLCLFNLYTEYIIQSARLDEAQTGIKIARRKINLRYADDTTIMSESKEELKSLLMKVKEVREKSGLKLNIHKTKIV